MKNVDVTNERLSRALEAMVVSAAGVVEDLRVVKHALANALTPFVLLPGHPGDETLEEALRRALSPERFPEASPAELSFLAHHLDGIWRRAVAGEDISPGCLKSLRALAETGSLTGRRYKVRSGAASDLGVELRFERGSWVVLFCAPCAAWYAEHGEPGRSGRAVARGEHEMLEVAAELCRRSLIRAGAAPRRGE